MRNKDVNQMTNQSKLEVTKAIKNRGSGGKKTKQIVNEVQALGT